MVKAKDFLKASEKEVEKLLEAYKEDLFGTCSETGERPADDSTHNCVVCRAFRADRVDQALANVKSVVAEQIVRAEAQDGVIAAKDSEILGHLAAIQHLREKVDDLVGAYQAAKADTLIEKRGNARLQEVNADLSAAVERHIAEIVAQQVELDTLRPLAVRVKAFINDCQA